MNLERIGASADRLGGFRLLLALAGLVSIVLGFSGMFFAAVIDSLLGVRGSPSASGFLAASRLDGAATLALAAGYVLAAVKPLRSRGLLIVLFLAPLLGAVALVISAAKGEISGPNGAALAAADLAWCLLFVRLYPRPETSAGDIAEPAAPADPSDK